MMDQVLDRHGFYHMSLSIAQIQLKNITSTPSNGIQLVAQY
jgi:hypothetical protein